MSTTGTPKTQVRHPDLLEKLDWYSLVLADKKLDGSAKAVAARLALYHHNSKTGRCDPSAAALAEGVGRWVSAIDPALSALRNAGWISWTSIPGRTNRYRLEKMPLRRPGTNSDDGPALSAGEVEIDLPPLPAGEGGLRSAGEGGLWSTGDEPVSEPRTEPVIVSPQPPTAFAARGSGPRKDSGRKREPRATARQSNSGTPLPANFELDAHRQKIAEIAAVPTPEIGNVFAGFISHARDKGRLSNDWDAAWDSWCRTNTEHRKKSQPQRPAVNPRYRV